VLISIYTHIQTRIEVSVAYTYFICVEADQHKQDQKFRLEFMTVAAYLTCTLVLVLGAISEAVQHLDNVPPSSP